MTRWRGTFCAVGVALVLATTLAACGFRPLHGRGSGGSPAGLSRVKIAVIADRTGQQMRNLLLDRLNTSGEPERPDFVLEVTLSEGKQNLAIRKDEIATRANLVVRATFRLMPTSDKKPILSSTAVSTVSYNILTSEFATLSAENDARRRAARELSDEIRTRVAMRLFRRAKER